MLIVSLFLMGLIAVVDAPRLVRQRRWREVAAWFSVWATAMTLALLRLLAVPLPTPAAVIIDVTRKLVRAVAAGG